MKVIASTILLLRLIVGDNSLGQRASPVRLRESHKFYCAGPPSPDALPYSLSLLCRVFRLMPRISAARVLLLLVAANVFRMSNFSASSTVVPTPSRTASGSLAPGRTVF